MKIRYILLMAAMMAAGACTSDHEEGRAGEPVPIRLMATVEGETAFSGQVAAWTRADQGPATRGIQEESIASGEAVYLWADKAAAGTYAYLKAWNLTSNGSGGFTGSTMYYPTDGSSLTFRAVHGNFSSAPAEGTAIGSLTHSVIADQSASGAYEHSDLMYGTGSGSWESAGTVSFGHKLSKIEVNLSPGVGLTPSDLASVVVQIRNVKPSVTINPTDGTVGSATGDAITVTARRTGTLYEAVIPPQALSASSITITRSGVTVTVPLAVASFAANAKYVYNVKCSNKDKRLNPLWYVAENNVKSYNSSTKVVTLETDPATAGSSQCYNWFDAMGYFSKQGSSYDEYWSGDITDGSTAFYYHLPCQMELMSIAPVYYVGSDSENMFIDNTNFVQEGNYTEPESIFGYSAETKVATSYKSYWSQYSTANERYALRYLGTPYCSVWKYQFDTGSHVLTMTAKLIDYLPDDTDAATLSSVLSTYMAKSASWWNSNDENEGAVQRKFYAVGLNLAGTGTPNSNANTTGYYWSTKEVSVSTHATYLQSGNERLYCIAADKTLGLTVRLFRSEGDSEARIDPGIPLNEVTSSHKGMVIATNGKVYLKKNIADFFSEGVAIICYVGSATGNSTYNHGLAISISELADAAYWTTSAKSTVNGSGYQYTTAGSFGNEDGSRYGTSFNKNAMNRNNSTYPAFQAAMNYEKTAPSQSTGWFLPSAYQFSLVANSVGGYDALRVYPSQNERGGSNFRTSFYWTCSECNATQAWDYRFPDYDSYWHKGTKEGGYYIRPFLAF